MTDWEDRLAAHMAAVQAQAPAKPKKAKAKREKPQTDDWGKRALDYFRSLSPGRQITSDDLDVVMGGTYPRRSNARGQIFQAAAKLGLLDDTGRTIPTSAPQARGRRIRVWSRTEKK